MELRKLIFLIDYIWIIFQLISLFWNSSFCSLLSIIWAYSYIIILMSYCILIYYLLIFFFKLFDVSFSLKWQVQVPWAFYGMSPSYISRLSKSKSFHLTNVLRHFGYDTGIHQICVITCMWLHYIEIQHPSSEETLSCWLDKVSGPVGGFHIVRNRVGPSKGEAHLQHLVSSVL